jgi:hypothetical protein
LPRQQRYAPPGRSDLAVESPSSPITIFAGHLPISRPGRPHPTMRPTSAPEGDDIATRSRRKWGSNEVVNHWLPGLSVELTAFCPASGQSVAPNHHSPPICFPDN